MVKPQQPELRRSDRGGTSDDATKERLTAPSAPGVDGAAGGPVPEDNRPGHHPPVEQDKPSGRDFVAKMHALAHEDGYEAPSPENEVLDITPLEKDPERPGWEVPVVSPVLRRLSPALRVVPGAGRLLPIVRAGRD